MDQKPFWVLTSAALDADGGDGPWSPNTQAVRQQLDEQLSKLSLQGKHLVIPGATPATLICHQDLADQVVDAVRACTSH